MPEILEEQKAIDPDDRELLERMVSKFISRHGGDVEKSLAEQAVVLETDPSRPTYVITEPGVGYRLQDPS